MAVGWNKVNGVFVSRAAAIAAGLTPPPPRRRVRAPEAPPAARVQQWPDDMSNHLPPMEPRKVVPFERPTLDQALQALTAPGPAPGETSSAGPPIPEGLPAAPVPSEITPIRPAPDDDPESFAALGGKLSAAGAVGLCGAILRRRGYEPKDPDDEDVERLERGAARAIRKSIGDREIPLWMELACGGALLYMSMSNGARKLSPEESGEQPAPAPEQGPELAAAARPATQVTQPPIEARRGGSTSRNGSLVTDRLTPIDVGPRSA